MSKKHIMIVDDSKVILRSAAQFLSAAGYEVSVQPDGFLALAALAERRPDVLLMDVMMPRLDGYAATLAIRNNPEFADLPVIMLSSKDSPFDQARGALIGCTDYLTKPFSKEQILEMVARHVRDE